MNTRRFAALILATTILAPAAISSAPQTGSLYIQVRSTKLRSKAEFWSSPLADLTYGAVLTPVSAAPTDKSWLKVKSDAVEGYVHVSAVTRRKIVFKAETAGKAGKNVDQSSIVLAGKGFNREIENKFGAAKGLDFAAVDEVEKTVVDPVEEGTFVSDGKLSA